MTNIKVVNMSGAEVGSMELNDSIFGVTPNEAVLHAAVRAYLLNQRQGTQSTLTRTEVSGGGRKPWKQKGTGRARQGSTRSPQWTHGGIALGPKPRSYRVDLNKKTKRVALFSALSAKVAGEAMIVVDTITAVPNEKNGSLYNTKGMIKMLAAVGAAKKTLVVLADNTAEVVKSFANIEGVTTTQANTLNVYDVLNCDTIVFAQGAVTKIEEVYAK